MFNKKSALCLLTCAGIGLAPVAMASKLILSPGVASLASLVPGDNLDMLAGLKPNPRLTSELIFDQFIIDRPLKIINTPDGINAKEAASLIVIKASSLSLTSTIEIVGTTADLLIVGTSPYGTASCTSCKFVNAGRVTFITWKPPCRTASLPPLHPIPTPP